jgi:hypothetical protein
MLFLEGGEKKLLLSLHRWKERRGGKGCTVPGWTGSMGSEVRGRRFT